MKINKLFLTLTVQTIISSTAVYAGDVEIHLPAATDAFTVDQPAGTELMRVHGNGNVGIGTAAPASQLDILGPTGAIITLRDGDATVNDPGHAAAIQLRDSLNNITGFLGFGTSAEGLSIQNLNDGGGIHFSTGGNVNQMTITESGDVGIGTISPAEKLHIIGNAVRVTSTGSYAETRYDSATKLGSWSVGTGGALDDGFYIFDYNAATDKNRLTIDNAGNVGIGIDENKPTAKLEVGGNIKVADSGAACDANTEGQIRYDSASNKHQGCDGTSWNNLY